MDTAVEEGLGFLDRWVFPDGSSPAHLNWRGTNFLMPYAIERRSVRFPPAGRLAARVRGAIRAGLLPTPATVDDRCASHLFLPSFVDAYLCAEPAGVPSSGVANAAPFESRDAGLILAVAGPLFAHIQARRGAFSVSGDGGPAWNDPGYLVRRGRSRYLPEPVECYGYDAGREYRYESSFRLLRGDGTSRPAAAAMAPCASYGDSGSRGNGEAGNGEGAKTAGESFSTETEAGPKGQAGTEVPVLCVV